MDGMSMATSTTAMSATGTMTGMAAATSTKAAMSGMGSSGCKISMLWNWNTIGSCYIASSWKITSNGMFAGSCIGVLLLTMSLEMLRRAVKEYDRYLIRNHQARWADAGSSVPSSESAGDHTKGPSTTVAAANGTGIPPFRPNILQQAIRALLHMVQFAVAYFIMLLAMYYNGYIIICIFLGSYIGSFIFQWETLYAGPTSAAKEATLGTITAEHARKDIESAKATGFDGFALNIGDPTASFIDTSLGYLFDAADSIGGFGLYVSMDVWASGDACWHGRDSCNGPLDYHWIFQKYKGRSSYYQWNSLPVISTFSAAGFDNIKWNKWKETLANEMFFIPDFDKTTGYYESHPGWWEYWGDLVDGLFSWESAWPERDGYGGRSPGDVSLDLSIAQGAHNHSKLYMVPLSFLQYKNSYNVSVYRAGLQALPMRMEGILDQMDQADFVQYLTWNDGPESHYIAELWPEQNSDAQPWLYMNQKMFDHTALQPLVASFNHAFKSRTESSSMTPQNGAVAVGAMWHRPMTDDAVCNPVVETIYTSRPSGSDDYYSRNMAYWSVVLKPGLPSGYKISIQAGEKEHTQVLTSGLNYGNGAGNIQAGIQTMKILDPSGKTIMSARSKRCVSSGCPQGIYNMNYLVTAFEDRTSESTCQPIGTEVMPMNAVKELEIPSCGSDKNHWLCQIYNASDISVVN
ncbi:hypothetical protein CcaCcLH18_03981 [Colletotrichum camelliae]|nr:hypothetical protein CcaCcLH18_03981 [Colletotrichum camelliae]